MEFIRRKGASKDIIKQYLKDCENEYVSGIEIENELAKPIMRVPMKTSSVAPSRKGKEKVRESPKPTVTKSTPRIVTYDG